jgi:hypothetical protein
LASSIPKIPEKLHKPANICTYFPADINIYAIAPCCHYQDSAQWQEHSNLKRKRVVCLMAPTVGVVALWFLVTHLD